MGPSLLSPSGMARGKLKASPLPVAMLCSFIPPPAPAFAPKEVSASLVVGSKNSSVTFTSIAVSVILLTRAVRPISSPSRTKRGTLGSTISSFWVTMVCSLTAVASSLSWAKSRNFQLVSASGLSKLMTRLPSASLARSGIQKAVSRRFLRICTGASASLTSGLGGGGGGGTLLSKASISTDSLFAIPADIDIADAGAGALIFLSILGAERARDAAKSPSTL